MNNEKRTENIEYSNRINRVLNYLDDHYSEEHSLESLANIANFSKYHFHRIFTGVVGESLYKYIQRIRIEKAAHSLKYQPKSESISNIAIDSGFSNSASFARSFKKHFGMTASQWREGAYKTYSKNCKEQSKDCKVVSNQWKSETSSVMYIGSSTKNPTWRISMLNRKNVTVEVKNIKEINIAYIRHIGAFKGETKKWAALFQRLIKWGGARGLINYQETQFFTVFRDDLKITEFSKFRADVCISVNPDTKAEGEIGISIIPSGKYAIAHFEIDGSEFEEAWDVLYSRWLPNSGFQPDERPCFERYLNDPKVHPKNKHIIEICIPVKAL